VDVIPLSVATRDRLEVLFEGADLVEAEQILSYECLGPGGIEGTGSTNMNGADPVRAMVERLRFAALKVSEGNLDELRRAVAWARVDSRDLLLWAGFDRDVRQHLDWFPETPPESG
jgi:hypothetical protein